MEQGEITEEDDEDDMDDLETLHLMSPAPSDESEDEDCLVLPLHVKIQQMQLFHHINFFYVLDTYVKWITLLDFT